MTASRVIVAAAVVILTAAAASAQIYPLTNGPNGAGPNTLDSAKGFDGINAVAPERELLYHPERGGNAAAQLGIPPLQGGDARAYAAPSDAPRVRHHAPHRRRRAPAR